MQASSLSRTPETDRNEQAAGNAAEATEISRKTRNDADTQEPARDVHAEGGCCGGCGG
ncbi:hypothetical protein [Paracandidimonas soli]|uniref:CCGSCS motif protein n=1 Tax=Paracandidimonas soli TaxID=1917182 RepID=A0A4R3V1A2_9BURK|nr:hypothetical protein [Paracandidimonas soli]TCU97262.1 hypothetical protein EV686_106144 [Paracandidimonas soli]